MKNIHLIPTLNPSRLLKQNNNKLILSKQIVYSHISKNLENINQNIYITNDEEIKEGEYGLSSLGKVVKFTEDGIYNYSLWKKIILTTDQDLIKDGVQSIPDEFLEWFVNNPSCEEIEVENIPNNSWGFDLEEPMNLGYKIILPKEEPKKYSQDDYFNDEFGKKKEPKQFVECKCTNAIQAENCIRNCGHGEEPKQETLEEVKDLAYYRNNAEEDYLEVPISVMRYISLLEQEIEKSYNEEDMKQFAFQCVANFLSNNDNKVEISLVEIILDRNSKKFNQFKKK